MLRTDSLGPEGEGHRVLSTRVTLDPRADLPSWVESETDALIDYARENDLGLQTRYAPSCLSKLTPPAVYRVY